MTFLITENGPISFVDFEALVEGMCEELAEWKHPKVAFAATPTIDTIVLFFACWKCGKIACPLSPRLPSFENALSELKSSLFVPGRLEKKSPSAWEWPEDQLATFLFTSGSSGKPKIACLSLGNHLYSALGSGEIIPLGPETVWQLSLPLYHVGGISIVVRCYLAKAAVLLSNQITLATHLSLVPTQLIRLIESKAQLPHLKGILLGGAPLPHLKSSWPVWKTYGMTEMSSQIATDGKILRHREVRLAPDGEIWVRGKTLFQGYLQEDGSLFLPLDAEGWFATGDLGRFSQDGLLEIVGRKDNLFISGGENIQPEEIEGLIKAIFGVEEAVVVPKADPEFGMRGVVFTKPYLELGVIARELSKRVPKFKVPIASYPLPESSALKVNRRQLSQKLDN